MSELVIDRDKAIPWATFFMEVPPSQPVSVIGLTVPLEQSLARLELWLYCENCRRETVSTTNPQSAFDADWIETTLVCTCLQCGYCPSKRFCIRLEKIQMERPKSFGIALKYGEWPLFRPPIPSYVRQLLG